MDGWRAKLLYFELRQTASLHTTKLTFLGSVHGCKAQQSETVDDHVDHVRGAIVDVVARAPPRMMGHSTAAAQSILTATHNVG